MKHDVVVDKLNEINNWLREATEDYRDEISNINIRIVTLVRLSGTVINRSFG
jgi:hypothetical protein